MQYRRHPLARAHAGRRPQYAVVRDGLSAAELEHLNGFCDRTQALHPTGERGEPWWAGDDGSLNW